MRNAKCSALLLIVLASVGLAQTWVTAPDNAVCAWQRYDGEYFPGTKMVYFLCGRINTTYYNTVYSFDAVTGTYTNTGDTVPIALVNWDVEYLQDNYNLGAGDTYGLYVVGGNNASGIQTALQVYHPRSNTSANITSDPVPLRSSSGGTVTGIAAVAANNKIYAFGGFSNADYSNCSQTWTYDPTLSAGSRWQQIAAANLSVGRGYIAGAVVDNYIYAIGGDVGGNSTLTPSNVVERLDITNPGAGWVAMASLPAATDETRAFGFGASSPDGWQNTIIVAGQGQWPNEYANSFIYSTTGNTWNSFAALNLSRRNHAGALIPPEATDKGLPEMWVWGGRYTSDANVRTIPEFCCPATTVSVTSPVGGEAWLVGSVHNITWTSTFSLTDSIVYSTNSGSTWHYVGKESPPSTRSFAWTVPNTPSANCLVRVFALNPSSNTSAQSASTFSIVLAPTASITAPNGGENWQVGVSHNITWTSANDTRDSLLYSTNNGTNWTFIANVNPPGSRSYPWSVPNAPSATCLVKVFAIGPGGTASAQSAGTFSIVAAPTASITAPNGGDNWQVGVSHNITWTSANDTRDSLLYSTNNGTNWTFIANVNPPGSRSYPWSVPNAPSATCLVKVFAIGPDPLGPIPAQSAGTFSIVAAPTVSNVVPAGGEKWEVLLTHNITWTSANDAQDSLLYSTNNGTNWTFIANVNPPGSRVYAWSVPNAPSATCLVKVFAIGPDPLGPIPGQSAGRFSIVATPTIGSLVPNGGEVWAANSHHNITWTSANSATDSIIFTRDGANWIYVGKQSPPTSRSFDWNVPGPASATCKVKVFALSGDPLGGASVQSASNFSIVVAPTVMVLIPNGGENWLGASIQNITWTSTNSNTDSIVWSADNGVTWSYVGKQTTITHSFAWTVPGSYGTQNLIKVFAIGPGSAVPDQSNATFTISPAVGSWSQMPNVLVNSKNKNVKDGGALAYGKQATDANDTGYVYALKGNNTCEFYRYNTVSSAWVSRDSIPAIGRSGKKKAVKKGSALASLGGNVYAMKGNGTLEFWRYLPATGWSQLADVPPGAKTIKEGAGLVAVWDDSDIVHYFLKGSGTQEFYRYRTSTDAWEKMADAPPGVSGKPYKNGSSLAYDGGDTIFALKGSYNEFFAYSISGNNWVSKDTLPKVYLPGAKKTKVKDGSQIAYAGRVVYALKGGNTNEFWTYKCNDHTWSAAIPLTTGNKKVKGGGALVTASDVNALYAFRGNNTLEFWKYGPIATFAFAPRIGNELKDEAQGQSAVQGSRFALSITPNPFTSRANISYSLPNAGNVSLRLYDISGKLVVTLVSGYRPAGAYSYSLLTTHHSLARGVYLLKFASDGCGTTEKLIIE